MRKKAVRRPAVRPQANLDHIAESLRPLAVPVAELLKDPANARKHGEKNLDAIKGSLAVYGQRKPIVVNKRTKTTEAGNGTLEAAVALGWTHLAVVYVDDDAATAAGFSIADNRTAELAEWDATALEGLLKDLATGNESLDAMLAELAATECPVKTEVTEDEVPEPPKVAVSKPGQLWLLGEHRLLCGDSTKAEDVALVMGGEKAGLCFTSPPYAQQRDYGAKITDWDGLMQGVFGNLPMTDAGQVLVNLGLVHRDGEWWPYWDGWIEWMRGQGWKRFGWYVWDKGFSARDEGGRLSTTHEWVFHFNRLAVDPEKWIECKTAGESRPITNGSFSATQGKYGASTKHNHIRNSHRIASSVLEVNRGAARGVDHPAAYPVEVPSYFMRSWPGIAYEPFLGSGTTLIAAHQLNRRCYGIEIEPRYIDVIIERWEKLTGQKARLG